MTIEQNIKDVMNAIAANPDLSVEIRRLAVEAIYAGQGSQAWTDYMKTFASPPTNPVQLARLTGVGDVACPDGPYIRQSRAYLISNGTCGTPTYDKFLLGVTGNLDKTLPPAPLASGREAGRSRSRKPAQKRSKKGNPAKK